MDVDECGMGRILPCRMQRRSAAVATMRVVTGITQDHLKRPGRDHIVIDDEDFFCRARNAGCGVGLGSIIDGWRVQSGHSRRTPHYVSQVPLSVMFSGRTTPKARKGQSRSSIEERPGVGSAISPKVVSRSETVFNRIVICERSHQLAASIC